MIASLKVKYFFERPTCSETFEKCFPLKAGFKFKEGENFKCRNTA
jgi:hypothetical protein